jgi:type II secretory pathway component PulF
VYKAVSSDGLEVGGELESASRVAALRELIDRGTNVTELSEKKRHAFSLLQGEGAEEKIRVRPKQVAFLTRQLAVSLEAGLTLMSSLDVIGRELDHRPSRELLKRLAGRVQQGDNLSDALAEFPETFSVMYVKLVKVGEMSGALDQVLTQLADMLERQVEMKERVKTASIYPAVLLLVGVASVAVIVTVIVPRIVSALGVETSLLPWPTRVLMGMSDFVGGYWWLMILGVVGAVVGWKQLTRMEAGRFWWDRVKLRIPILGRLIVQIEAARFAHSLGILVRGGMTITESLAVTRETVRNTVIGQSLLGLSRSIQAGESIAGQLQSSGLFPPLLVQMVRVGENTGKLDEMLLRAAKIHESETRVTLDRFVNVFPVAMILVLAGLIGFIVAGLVLAIVEFQTVGVG